MSDGVPLLNIGYQNDRRYGMIHHRTNHTSSSLIDAFRLDGFNTRWII